MLFSVDDARNGREHHRMPRGFSRYPHLVDRAEYDRVCGLLAQSNAKLAQANADHAHEFAIVEDLMGELAETQGIAFGWQQRARVAELEGDAVRNSLSDANVLHWQRVAKERADHRDELARKDREHATEIAARDATIARLTALAAIRHDEPVPPASEG